jgi:hypothetical protein
VNGYRWIAPASGPTKTAAELARWAVGELIGVPGVILANSRDLPALRATMLAERLELPTHGVVQPGTLWIQGEVPA